MGIELSNLTFTEQDDIVPASGVEEIFNSGIVNTLAGNDIIIGGGSRFSFVNHGVINTGDGDDILIGTGIQGIGIFNNKQTIDTGDGDDTITGIGNYALYNDGTINTGNGDDSIIADGSIYGFYSVINGYWFLGEGDDYIKGYGYGDFYGGNGNDTLELTPGTYTVGIYGEGGESLTFTKNNQLMITSEFEKLIAGSTIYDFTSLTAGQIISVC